MQAAAGGDQVELSTLAGMLARALGADAARRATRVGELTAEYRGGRYQVDVEGLGRTLLLEMVAGLRVDSQVGESSSAG
jgi:hypothetical protein